ncbi:sugar ABC transporter ATP-binding protein [Curtobacterium sp. BRB10]|uniref:sugar ABC transporter ATP-binding protein n=1 Tax=Curtobacterium sp. BRB10 TaxID=2962579 RepID=UPI0028814CD9|nr:sugar ABC transporter ATP-binding protein [Curtobacterium sp. BRB10]MDT0234858.1 sugar ABC transporter ATP-binding protein [Curtobacterium sp. BRB10]
MTTTPPPATRTAIAEVRGARKQYPGVLALDDVDFTITPGEVRALLGQNGAGKSTLIRLLSGVERPDTGSIVIDGSPLTGGVTEAGRRGVATCYQELSLIRDITVAENLSLGKWPTGPFGIDRRRMVRSARVTLERLGADIDPDAVVSSLTLAQQQIVEIARAVQEEPKLLILDEPTSALATAEVDIVLATVKRLSAEGVAVLYVSHRMDEIRQIADTATVMRNGRVIETVDIAGADTNRIIHLMLGEALESAPSVRKASTSGEVLLRVEDLVLAPKLDGVTFEARAGEVLGIAGLLGTGRTELLRAIAGYERSRSGMISIRGTIATRPTSRRMRQLGVGMTPEDRKATGIIPGLGIDENIVMSDWKRVSAGGFLATGRIRAATKALGQRLAIKADDLSRPINTLSGGNQQKAVIARWLHADSDVLLLDEPTRGVDVQAKAQIYDIMRQVADSGKAVVFVSSEAEELPLACDRVLVLRGGRIREEFVAPDITVPDVLAASMGDHLSATNPHSQRTIPTDVDVHRVKDPS